MFKQQYFLLILYFLNRHCKRSKEISRIVALRLYKKKNNIIGVVVLILAATNNKH